VSSSENKKKPEAKKKKERRSPEDKELSRKLGVRIRALRLKRGWTQTELGVYCDELSRVHISDLERGKREVGLYVLRKIARALEITPSRLLSGF
jgi:ribosome-binding protein aMBF1 (putative translation factor)